MTFLTFSTMPTIQRNALRSVNSSRAEKRVSFEDLSDQSRYKIEKVDPKKHTIQIEEFFTERNYRPILRNKLPELDHVKPVKSRSMPDRKRSEHNIPRKPYRLPPFKKPTETLSHAILRSMSFKEPNRRTRLPKVDLIVKVNPEVVTTERSPRRITVRGRNSPSSQASYTSLTMSSKSNYSAPEAIAFNSNAYDVVIKCGACLKRKRTSPAAGFCRFCDEYLCASCIYQHRGVLTRSHPVLVFNCDTCKEMNVLHKKDSGFCVNCKKYFCSLCVISHCSVNNHDVLEGDDLIDVVYATIHRGFV